ncbi:hypothetical protein ACP70R_036013 [Stipagrostis hirtigluma subsp. patula]
MADDEGGLFGLPAYVDEEDAERAAAKAEREKRREGGEWSLDKIREKAIERMREEAAKRPPSLPYPRLDAQAESPAGPMRHLPFSAGGPQLASSANIISVKVVESAVGYPLDVYGAIFVRDELDCKRIYVFRRDPDNCQRISSKDEHLFLTGPSRGLLAFKNLYFEIHLKCKKREATDELELGKWLIKDSAFASTSNVVRNRFVGKLCAVDLTYAPVHRAVEVTVEFKILKILRIKKKPNGLTGEQWLPFNEKMKEYLEFHGTITACIDGIPEDVALYDSKAPGCAIRVGDGGVLQLSRRVLAVPIDKKVSFKIASHDGVSVISDYPSIRGCSCLERIFGSYHVGYKLAWSALYSPKVDGLPHCMSLHYL